MNSKTQMQNKTKHQFDGRWIQKNISFITMNKSKAWDARHTGGRKTDRGKVLYVNHKHKLIQPRHSHSLPVLLMFLKLPKLFNFHILRLAAEHEISTGRGNRGQAQVFRKRLLRNIQRNTNTSAQLRNTEETEERQKNRNMYRLFLIGSSYLAEQVVNQMLLFIF